MGRWEKHIIVLFTFGALMPPSSSSEAPTYSSLVYKMKGVCSEGDPDERLKSSCSLSARSLFYDPMIATKTGNFSERNYIKVKMQNHILLTELVHRAFYDTTPPEHKPEFGFQHLTTAFSIYSKVCPQVSTSFLQKVYHLFAFLHFKTAVDRTELLSKAHHKWITRLLNNCTENVEGLQFYTDVCKDSIIAVENCENLICTKPEHEFHLRKSDGLLDAVFKVFELTQSVCFPMFHESYRMFHFFHMAVMDTFTDDIKIRWTTPIERTKFFRRLLGPSFETEMLNMERCNEATISKQKFNYRIARTSLPARLRLSGGKGKVG